MTPSVRRVWALRYSTSVRTLREEHPDSPRLHERSHATPLVVSEPLGELVGAWNEVPESSCGGIQEGQDEPRPFSASTARRSSRPTPNPAWAIDAPPFRDGTRSSPAP